MVREFTVESLVSLPRLNVDSGQALFQALQAAVSSEKKLPKFVLPAWQRVASAGESLAKAATERLAESGSKSPPAARRKADSVVDNAVAALDSFLAAWARLPDTYPESQLALCTRQALFPDGIGFLRLSYEEQWAQIERRVQILKQEGHTEAIAKLGGAALVNHLLVAQAAYGEALGLTKVTAVPTEPVGLREPLDAFVAALRVYVIKVTAYRDEDEPETVAQADRLLRPLLMWSSKAPRSGGAVDPVPPSPAVAPAPSQPSA